MDYLPVDLNHPPSSQTLLARLKVAQIWSKLSDIVWLKWRKLFVTLTVVLTK